MPKVKRAIIFDLDDTLYKEIEYLKSAFKSIAKIVATENGEDIDIVYHKMLLLYHDKKNAFEEILNVYKTSLTINELLVLYRNHKPNIKLSKETFEVLQFLKEQSLVLGLLTDGRSIQQRNKLKALGLEDFFAEVIVSEEFGSTKPNENNYIYFEQAIMAEEYWYIGDNLSKDFISPKKRGWKTIRLLDNGLNIHKHNPSNFSHSYFPDISIREFSDIISIFKSNGMHNE